VAFCFGAIHTVNAGVGDRTLTFYNTHNNERTTVTFKRNGQYDRAGLRQLNRTLRDWRTHDETEMDPRLADLLWEVYQQTGSSNPIHIVSGYRAPKTNAMLRRRSSGVAENSQHMRGKALDFFIPGVDLSRLRAIGLRMQVGGVGFYPSSGSPFVHLDTGSVRHWPRMTRQQLVAVFPEGRSLHIPSDGRPLPGYAEAQAAFKARGQTVVALGGRPSPEGRSAGGNLIANLFDRDRNAAPAAAPPAAETQVAAFEERFDAGQRVESAAPMDPPPLPRRNPNTLSQAPVAVAGMDPIPDELFANDPMPVLAFASPTEGSDPLAMLTEPAVLAAVAGKDVPVSRPAPRPTLVPTPTLGGWIDPFARLAFVQGDRINLPLFDGGVTTRQRAFAYLAAPYTGASPEFFDKPPRTVAMGFVDTASLLSAGLRTDRFAPADMPRIRVVDISVNRMQLAAAQ
jgi:uncharacterized protein YcbK (DUF882 family)